MRLVKIDYTNWRGERRERMISPQRLVFGANQWHKTAQWLLVATDCQSDRERSFAVKDIHSWTPVGGIMAGIVNLRGREPFEPGDTVALKCGSGPMVVLSCKGGDVAVAWHDDAANPVEHAYPAAALEHVEVK